MHQSASEVLWELLFRAFFDWTDCYMLRAAISYSHSLSDTKPSSHSKAESLVLCLKSDIPEPVAKAYVTGTALYSIDLTPKTLFTCWVLMKASRNSLAVGNPAALQLHHDDFDLPSHDALAQILPQYLQSDSQQKPSTEVCKPNLNLTYRKQLPVCSCDDDPSAARITDLQIQEVQKYRAAMGRMAADLISLRTQLVALQTENSQLRSDLALHRDLGLDLLKDSDLDVMTKTEMADRIASLSFRLSNESRTSAAQTDRIQQLQNQLIWKNDSEKELLRLQSVHQQQQELQHQQTELRRMRVLEETVRHQGKVTVKLERALQSKLTVKSKPSIDRGLVMRKRRGEAKGPKECAAGVRDELHRPLQPPTVIIHQVPQKKDPVSVREKLGLLAELERSEARLKILEQQLEENSKLWGKQKQQMMIQLSEQNHGLDKTSRTTLQN